MDVVIVWDWDSGKHSPAIVIARTSDPWTPTYQLEKGSGGGATVAVDAGSGSGWAVGWRDQGEVNSLSPPP